MQSSIFENIPLFIGTLSLIYWVISWLTMRQNLSGLKILAQLPAHQNEHSATKLSIIVTACNEAANLKKSIPLLLAQTYRSIELILINDRSQDDTGEIIEFFASQDSRIRTIHIEHLPEGWLGKVNAMQKDTRLRALKSIQKQQILIKRKR